MKKFTVTWDEIHVIRYQSNIRAAGGKMAEKIVKTNFKKIREMNAKKTVKKTIHVKNLKIHDDTGA
ncbi:MAG: hypothetical protein D3926_17440 [Desulfobacteraceae bacterium]|nr:MAG: hypothetical protein D3926_17440 [Desulfobacteraceae bacterium]